MTKQMIPSEDRVSNTSNSPAKKLKKDHPLYATWRAMRFRCNCTSSNRWHLYGGRDVPITICERWNDFYLFASDMGDKKPSKRHSLDRINVNGNYEPGNCRWATPRQQSLNQRPRGVTLYKRICKHCSSEFQNKRPVAVYCSKKCSDNFRKGRVPDGFVHNPTTYSHTCKFCNAEFTHTRKRKRVYCSKKCTDDAKREGKNIKCLVCKKDIWVCPSHLSMRRCCSKSCASSLARKS